MWWVLSGLFYDPGNAGRGRSNKEIGATLGIEERTVKAHVVKLLRKVRVQNRIAFSVHAVTHSLVSRQSKTAATEQIQHSESV